MDCHGVYAVFDLRSLRRGSGLPVPGIFVLIPGVHVFRLERTRRSGARGSLDKGPIGRRSDQCFLLLLRPSPVDWVLEYWRSDASARFSSV